MKIISLLILLSFSGMTKAALITYQFNHDGFNDGSIISGAFSGEDLNGDGELCHGKYNGCNELTTFSMTFSGGTEVSPFTIYSPDEVITFRLNLLNSILQIDEPNEQITVIPGGDGSRSPLEYSASSNGGYVTNYFDFSTTRSQNYASISNTEVPLPGSLWLFFSAIVVLFSRNYKSKTMAI